MSGLRRIEAPTRTSTSREAAPSCFAKVPEALPAHRQAAALGRPMIAAEGALFGL
jgi:hypothetical protein